MKKTTHYQKAQQKTLKYIEQQLKYNGNFGNHMYYMSTFIREEVERLTWQQILTLLEKHSEIREISNTQRGAIHYNDITLEQTCKKAIMAYMHQQILQDIKKQYKEIHHCAKCHLETTPEYLYINKEHTLQEILKLTSKRYCPECRVNSKHIKLTQVMES